MGKYTLEQRESGNNSLLRVLFWSRGSSDARCFNDSLIENILAGISSFVPCLLGWAAIITGLLIWWTWTNYIISNGGANGWIQLSFNLSLVLFPCLLASLVDSRPLESLVLYQCPSKVNKFSWSMLAFMNLLNAQVEMWFGQPVLIGRRRPRWWWASSFVHPSSQPAASAQQSSNQFSSFLFTLRAPKKRQVTTCHASHQFHGQIHDAHPPPGQPSS